MGYLKQILCDNGTEFKNETGKKFAEENKIQLKHGSPQTPATQGLVERSNRTWKEDIESYYHEQGKQRPWVPCMGLGSHLGLAFLGIRNCFLIFLVIQINYFYFISLIICLLFILS